MAKVTHRPIEETRQLLVDGALSVISKEGIAAATTRRIAEAARVQTGTVHYCFSGKDDLLAAAYNYAATAVLADVQLPVFPASGIKESVAIITRQFARSAIREPDLQKAQYELTLWAWRSQDFRHLAQRVFRRYIDGTVQFLREAYSEKDPKVDLQVLSRMIISAIDGAQWQWLSLDDGSMEKMTEAAISAMQAYIDSQPPQDSQNEMSGLSEAH